VGVVTGISPGTIDELRRRLEDERAGLLGQITGVDDAVDQPTATSGHGETEHVQLAVDRALATSLDRSLRTALESVAYALARIDDGSYGACAECSVPIPTERLMAVPWTSRCVRCQTRFERRG
jgi:DnaK suppressor protein